VVIDRLLVALVTPKMTCRRDTQRCHGRPAVFVRNTPARGASSGASL